MAGELLIAGPTDSTLYAHILDPSAFRWNGSSFESYLSANYANYVVAMVEQGSSGVYVGDFPSAITDANIYEMFYYLQAGASPSEGDQVAGTGSITWSGTQAISTLLSVTGEMEGPDFASYVLRSFKRTDKSTELYEAVNDSIAEIRRNIRTAREETETTVTDTIATLGEYKLDVETDFGQFVSDVFIRDSGNGRHLIPISKSMFDNLYSKWGTGSSERGLPRHYCLYANQILIGPIPDSISYVYVVSYTKENYGAVSAATTSVPFTKPDYREILRNGVLWRLYKLVENDDQAGAYKALWDLGLAQIDAKERHNRGSFVAMAYRDV